MSRVFFYFDNASSSLSCYYEPKSCDSKTFLHLGISFNDIPNLMRIIFFLLMILLFLSCKHKINSVTESSSLLNLKDSFAIKNLKEFVIDSNIQSSYRIFNKIKNKQIDSAISYGTHYLYSWQQRDSAFIEFTTIIDDGEHGLRIVYFVFDKKDSMLSTTQVANKGGEGGIIYETLSQFKSKDTLFHIRSASTKTYPLAKKQPFKR